MRPGLRKPVLSSFFSKLRFYVKATANYVSKRLIKFQHSARLYTEVGALTDIPYFALKLENTLYLRFIYALLHIIGYELKQIDRHITDKSSLTFSL